MFKHLDAAILNHIRRRGVVPQVDDIRSTDRGFDVRYREAKSGAAATRSWRWSELRAATAVQSAGWVGGHECLLVDCGAEVLQLTADADGFDAFLMACERNLPGWLPATQWRVQLMMRQPGEGVEVFGRGGNAPST